MPLTAGAGELDVIEDGFSMTELPSVRLRPETVVARSWAATYLACRARQDAIDTSYCRTQHLLEVFLINTGQA